MTFQHGRTPVEFSRMIEFLFQMKRVWPPKMRHAFDVDVQTSANAARRVVDNFEPG
jgi:hypothetical protein